MDLASLVTAFVAAVTGVFLLLRRGSAMTSTVLAVVMLSAALWAGLGFLAVVTAHLPTVLVLTRVICVVAAVQTAAAAWFCLTLAGSRLAGRHALVLAVEPVLLVLAAAADPRTGALVTDLVLGDHAAGELNRLVFGPVFWLHTGYCYALLTLGAAVLLRAATRAVPGHRAHYRLAVVAMAPPTVGNVVSVLGAQEGWRDLTAPGFLVTALVWFWVDRLSSRFRSSPITTPQVLSALTDGVVVLDEDGSLVDANPAAVRLLLGRDDGRVGELLGDSWRAAAAPDLVAALRGGDARVLVRPDGAVVDIRSTAVSDGDRQTGWVVVARDITEVERLRAELADQALRDGLTGLHNRRYLERVLAAGVAGDGALLLALLDLDHFKQVNDRFGHLVGDRVLVAVAGALGAGAGPDDVVARLGGEEFVVVMTGLTVDEAMLRVESLRRRCADVVVPVPGGEARVTVSAGLAVHRPGGTVEQLLADADTALYAAKGQGRDRLVLAEPGTSSPHVASGPPEQRSGDRPSSEVPAPSGAALRRPVRPAR